MGNSAAQGPQCAEEVLPLKIELGRVEGFALLKDGLDALAEGREAGKRDLHATDVVERERLVEVDGPPCTYFCVRPIISQSFGGREG